MYRHRFTYFTDALVPVYNRAFEVLAGGAHEAFRTRVIESASLPWGVKKGSFRLLSWKGTPVKIAVSIVQILGASVILLFGASLFIAAVLG
jgi:hypothetical protein